MKKKIHIGKVHVALMMVFVVLVTTIGVSGSINKTQPWHSWNQIDLAGANPWTGLTAEHVDWEDVTGFASSEHVALMGICEDSHQREIWLEKKYIDTTFSIIYIGFAYVPMVKKDFDKEYIYLGIHQKCFQSAGGAECETYTCNVPDYIKPDEFANLLGDCKRCSCPAGSFTVTHNTGSDSAGYLREITYCYNMVS